VKRKRRSRHATQGEIKRISEHPNGVKAARERKDQSPKRRHNGENPKVGYATTPEGSHKNDKTGVYDRGKRRDKKKPNRISKTTQEDNRN